VTRLAVFDLDGTLTWHDTLPQYVCGLLARRPWQLARLLGVLPAAARFAMGPRDHGLFKARFLRVTLGGRRRSELASWTEQFTPRLLARGLRAAGYECLQAHQRAGDVCVLLSASPDLYVPAIGTALGFREVICTGVRWVGEHLDGALSTPNRRGHEKTRCFGQLRERFPGLPTIAYGNAASDLEHLAQADEALLVNASARARRAAARLGIPTGDWS